MLARFAIVQSSIIMNRLGLVKRKQSVSSLSPKSDHFFIGLPAQKLIEQLYILDFLFVAEIDSSQSL